MKNIHKLAIMASAFSYDNPIAISNRTQKVGVYNACKKRAKAKCQKLARRKNR